MPMETPLLKMAAMAYDNFGFEFIDGIPFFMARQARE
jgi:hypothetical protein